MPTTARPGLPEFWVTGLARVLMGDQPCRLEAWAKAHFKLPKKVESPAMANWKATHTELLRDEIARLKAEGWKVRVEQFFRLQGQTAILSGKPDVIAQQDGKRPKIVDTKGGDPRESDICQVMIYWIVIPLVWDAPGMTFEGEVVYRTHRVPITAQEIAPMRPKVFALLRDLAATKPEPNPSEGACRFCDVPEDICSSRYTGTSQVDVSTSEF